MENIPKVKFSSGEVIFKEGEFSNSVYLIISGKVEISRQIHKKTVVLATQGKNTIFGEMALIDGKPRSANVKAIEPSECYKCSAAGILNELNKIDRDIHYIMQNLAAIIRKNNDLELKKHALKTKDIIFNENVVEPFMTKDEIINNHELAAKIEALSPFIRSMYRLLLQIAYKD